MSDETKVPAIPQVPAGIDPALTRFLSAIKEVMQVREGSKGNALDSAVTFRDLVDAGLATTSGYTGNRSALVSPSITPQATGADATTQPVKLENVRASAGDGIVIVTWDAPYQSFVSYAEIYRNTVDNVSTWQLVGKGTGQLFVDYDIPVGESNTFYYWAKPISIYGVSGAVSQTTTHSVVRNVASAGNLLATLNAAGLYPVSGQPYFYVPVDTTYDGVFIPAGTYMWSAIIQQLKASQISFGTAVGDTIEGARIHAGVITGSTIDGTSITGGTISGTTIQASGENGIIVAPKFIGGEIQGSHIYAGGTVNAPYAEITDGGIIRTWSHGSSVSRYTEMSDGGVVSYRYFPEVGYKPRLSLTRMVTGEIDSGGLPIELEGHWEEKPEVLLTVSDAQVYNSSYHNNDQKLVISQTLTQADTDPAKEGFYKWSLSGKAELWLGSSAGTIDSPVDKNGKIIQISKQPTNDIVTLANGVSSANFTVYAKAWKVTDSSGDSRDWFLLANISVDVFIAGAGVSEYLAYSKITQIPAYKMTDKDRSTIPDYYPIPVEVKDIPQTTSTKMRIVVSIPKKNGFEKLISSTIGGKPEKKYEEFTPNSGFRYKRGVIFMSAAERFIGAGVSKIRYMAIGR